METLSKTKKIILSAASFPALISFQIWATADRAPEGQIIAASSMLAYCVLVIVISYRWDKPGYFDWAIAAYFTVISIALLLWPEGASQYLRHYAATGIYVCLFSAAFFPASSRHGPLHLPLCQEIRATGGLEQPHLHQDQPNHDLCLVWNLRPRHCLKPLSFYNHAGDHSQCADPVLRFPLQFPISRLLPETTWTPLPGRAEAHGSERT